MIGNLVGHSDIEAAADSARLARDSIHKAENRTARRVTKHEGGLNRFLLIHESHPAMSARYGMGWVRAAL